MTKLIDSELAALISDRPPTKERWQFSLRGMLLLMTIVAISLAFARQYPRTMGVLLAVGIVQAVVLCGADWLIQAKNARILAFLTASLWAVFATSLFALFVRQFFVAVAANADSSELPVAFIYAAGSAFSYYIAWRRVKNRKK